MTKILNFLFEDWRRPILFLGVAWIAVFISDYFEINQLGTLSYVLLGLAIIGLLISTIYQFVKRRWIKGIFTFSLIIGSFLVFLLLAVSSFFINTIDGDRWADNLTIPTNIELFTPIGDELGSSNDSLKNIQKSKLDFELFYSFQPGLYEYTVWVDKIEKGKIYLKAFEVTQEYQLSEDRLKEKSIITINNQSDTIVSFSLNDHFTIYEGDWGKPYAARFEVWFKPENESPERKLIEKIYKIEGWMR